MLTYFAEKLINTFFAFIPRPEPDPVSLSQVRLIAHRGMHKNAQRIFENTLPAFQKAQEAGCWGIEFDIRRTQDGVLMINHDDSLKRLWGHDYCLSEMDFAQVRALEPCIPTLTEVVQAYGKRMHLFIELKASPKDEHILIEELRGLTPCDDYHLLSLDAAIFEKLQGFPKQCLLLVPELNAKEFCELSIKRGYGGVMGSYLLMTHNYMNQLQQANQLVGVGFVDSKNSLYREINRGIKYIFSNRIDKLSALVP